MSASEPEGGGELLERARRAASSAYAPYSRFRVGAALVAGGRVVEGCNVENASYGLSMCAERVAAFAARSQGLGPVTALAVSCIDAPADAPAGAKMPCGACRLVLAELCEPSAAIWVDGVGQFSLSELLPHAFLLSDP